MAKRTTWKAAAERALAFVEKHLSSSRVGAIPWVAEPDGARTGKALVLVYGTDYRTGDRALEQYGTVLYLFRSGDRVLATADNNENAEAARGTWVMLVTPEPGLSPADAADRCADAASAVYFPPRRPRKPRLAVVPAPVAG
jgi:hypothetical protein